MLYWLRNSRLAHTGLAATLAVGIHTVAYEEPFSPPENNAEAGTSIITFARGSSRITDSERADLEEIAKQHLNWPSPEDNVIIVSVLSGNCASIFNYKSNAIKQDIVPYTSPALADQRRSLSEDDQAIIERFLAVQDALVELGVDPKNIVAGNLTAGIAFDCSNKSTPKAQFGGVRGAFIETKGTQDIRRNQESYSGPFSVDTGENAPGILNLE